MKFQEYLLFKLSKALACLLICIAIFQGNVFAQKNACYDHDLFSVCYPNTFLKKEKKSNFFASDANGSSIAVTINKEKPGPSMTPWDIPQKSLEAAAKPMYPSYKITKMEKKYINGKKGLIVYSQIDNVRQISLFISSDQYGYVVTCTTKSFYELYQKPFLASIQSFKTK